MREEEGMDNRIIVSTEVDQGQDRDQDQEVIQDRQNVAPPTVIAGHVTLTIIDNITKGEVCTRTRTRTHKL